MKEKKITIKDLGRWTKNTLIVLIIICIIGYIINPRLEMGEVIYLFCFQFIVIFIILLIVWFLKRH